MGRIWGCQSVDPGLDGQRDGGERGREILAKNFLAVPMPSLCGHLACHTGADVH